jgi:hypothetical protein
MTDSEALGSLWELPPSSLSPKDYLKLLQFLHLPNPHLCLVLTSEELKLEKLFNYRTFKAIIELSTDVTHSQSVFSSFFRRIPNSGKIRRKLNPL